MSVTVNVFRQLLVDLNINLTAALTNSSEAAITIESLQIRITALKSLVAEEPNATQSFNNCITTLRWLEGQLAQLQSSNGGYLDFSARKTILGSLDAFVKLQAKYFTESTRTLQDLERKHLEALQNKINGQLATANLQPQVHGGVQPVASSMVPTNHDDLSGNPMVNSSQNPQAHPHSDQDIGYEIRSDDGKGHYHLTYGFPESSTNATAPSIVSTTGLADSMSAAGPVGPRARNHERSSRHPHRLSEQPPAYDTLSIRQSRHLSGHGQPAPAHPYVNPSPPLGPPSSTQGMAYPPANFVETPTVTRARGGAKSKRNNLAQPVHGINPSPQYQNPPQVSAHHPANQFPPPPQVGGSNYKLHPASNPPFPPSIQSAQYTGSTPYPANPPSAHFGDVLPNPHYSDPRSQWNESRTHDFGPAQPITAPSGLMASSDDRERHGRLPSSRNRPRNRETSNHLDTLPFIEENRSHPVTSPHAQPVASPFGGPPEISRWSAYSSSENHETSMDSDDSSITPDRSLNRPQDSQSIARPYFPADPRMTGPQQDRVRPAEGAEYESMNPPRSQHPFDNNDRNFIRRRDAVYYSARGGSTSDQAGPSRIPQDNRYKKEFHKHHDYDHASRR